MAEAGAAESGVPSMAAETRAGVFAGLGGSGAPAWAIAGDGCRVRYETSGQGDVLLAFVHGGMCDRSFWARQLSDLTDSYRVLSLDLPGHGESQGTRGQWSMEGFGDDVARVVRAASAGRVVLVGHSMGGPVVIEAARRLSGCVAGIVLVDILHQPSPKVPPPPATDLDGVKAAMRRGMFTPDADPSTRDRIIDALTSMPSQVAAPIRKAFAAYDAAAALRAVAEVPLSMILSDLRPVDAAGIRTLHPGARILVMKGAGHFVMVEMPSAFNALLRSEVLAITGSVSTL